ncbi:hypothetical protein EV193_11746 [Herbihabitans rhizosphaerae]|uniref:Fe2OG dioxygenase domain-containing protein n=1 Tax=Herbihabitans rhizosphaerae TaxID=1872711 RepID=A0A4Q7KE86_9PSEU|nr:arpA protein [Herbihabitans rhizosphaerae]RZS30350.1 hypothetical protein EV193_11746 [Herbihabitans rhizosphaerae]
MGVSDTRVIDLLVDTDRYPLTSPDSSAAREVVERVHGELRDGGCSVLTGFIRPELHESLRLEGERVEAEAYDDVEIVNAYNIDTGTPLPPGHPGRMTMERGNAFVARDRLPANFLIHQLYTSALFQRFVARCFELPEVHELADPLSGLVLNVVRPGMSHPWHFDINEFTVSMLTRAPEDGGGFEYCPNIRSAEAERFDDVRGVLTGRRDDLVRELTLRPGDLQLFKGRYSLHRVTTVRGAIPRHTAIFAYSERPGVLGSVARTKQLFGRVLEQHLDAQRRAVRVDQLLD